MYIIARQGTHVPESVHVYTIKNDHIDICKYVSIDKCLCSRFNIRFVTVSGVYVQFGRMKGNESERTPSWVVPDHFQSSLQ